MASHILRIALVAAPVLSVPFSAHAPRSGISWNNCTETPGISRKVQCANLSVPINWDEPEGPTFNLGMVRLLRPPNSTAERIGYLFINPGGPGNSATATVAKFAEGNPFAEGLPNISSDIMDRFDLIGVDPRGVGHSAPLQCDSAIWKERVSQFPKTKEEYDRLVDKNKRLGESCLKRTGDIANYLDTISAAKDHEAVRAALGEEMNWLGLSYGTQLGAQYAQLFPQNIRAMALDGILQHSQAESSNILIESTAYAVGLTSFFEWAGTNDASPLKGQDVEKLWYSILKNATDKPIPAPGCDGSEGSCYKDVTEDEFRLNAQGFLIFPTSRIAFAKALLQAGEGNATPFSSRLPAKGDPRFYPAIGIACQDWSSSASSFEDFQAKMRMAEVFSPLSKGASQSWTVQASCVGWPTARRNPPAKLKVQTEAPILMVNSNRDPSTGYPWAVGMLEEIKNSVLVTRIGDGHTSWLLGEETANAVNDFLITLKLPAVGTVLNS
jgi:pimeloyl-ACP methyl ester carboxylesterase